MSSHLGGDGKINYELSLMELDDNNISLPFHTYLSKYFEQKKPTFNSVICERVRDVYCRNPVILIETGNLLTLL